MSPQLKNRMDRLEEALGALSQEIKKGDLVEKISAESRLEPASAAWSLRKWLESIRRADIELLVNSAKREGSPAWNVTTLAPGNVPVVAAECLLLGYLAGFSHCLALSRRASIVARTLFSCLLKQDPSASETTRLVIWQELPEELQQKTLSSSDCVAVYGQAETVELVHSMIPPSARLVPHGPSLAAAYLPAQNTICTSLRKQLDALAHDVLAFDQRGCRSPHILFVEGSREWGQKIYTLLSERSFPRAAQALPNGPLMEEEVQALYLDRLTSLSLGQAVSGEGWLLNFEPSPYIPRTAPPGRAFRVLSVPGTPAMVSLLESLHAPVGLLLTPDGAPVKTLTSSLDGTEVLSFGSAHASPFCRLHDGRHRLDELLPSAEK